MGFLHLPPTLAARIAARQTSSTEILNFALTLEYLEDEFYKAGLASGGLIPGADRPIFEQIGRHETAHVALLRSVLGNNAISKPDFDFTAGGVFADVFSNYQTFLALAQGFEDTGVRAYKGQAPGLLSDPDLLTAALQIHSVEARHASEVRRLRGEKGWIVGDTTDVAALAAVYAGEDNTVHAGADATQFTMVGRDGVTEAWDEPLTRDAVLAIASPFLLA